MKHLTEIDEFKAKIESLSEENQLKQDEVYGLEKDLISACRVIDSLVKRMANKE